MRATLIVEEPGAEAQITNAAELAPNKGATAVAS
jgi:hypothetical protein